MVSTPKETTQKQEPWDGAKPYILEQYALADKLLKNGAPKQWTGKNIADESKATTDALKGVENLARNGDTSTLKNSTTALNSVLNQGTNTPANQTLSQIQNGVNLGTNPTQAMAMQIANGQTAQAPGQYNANYTNAATGLQQSQANSLANSNNPSLAYLQQTASGANIGKNPYLDSMVSNQQDKIADKLRNVTNPAIDSNAAAIGRIGSGAYAAQRNNAESAAANEMAKVATDMYGNQYNQDVASQQNAANMYGNFYNNDVANRMNANQALSATDLAQQQQRMAASNSMNSQFNANRDYQMQGMNLASNNYQNNIQNMLANNDQRMNAANSQLTSANNVNAQKLQAAGMAGDIYSNQYLPYQQLAGVGKQKDDRASLELQAAISKWDQKEQQPIQNVANMLTMLQGGNYQNTTQPVYSNPIGQVGGLISGLAGLFALCSRVAKTVHSVVGYMPLTNGAELPIYSFSYIDDPDQKIWVGPIAEMLEEEAPDAVVEFGGLKHIDVASFIREAA